MGDVRWSSFYYPEILEQLRAAKRAVWPEHTETDPHDPVEQFLRLAALVGHQQAVRLDHVARELGLPTLQLRSSLAALAALVGYRLDPASPAEVDLVADLAGALVAPTAVLAARSIASVPTGTEVYEYPSSSSLSVTATGAWTLLQDDGGVVTALATPTGTLWAGAAAAGDALYLLHPEAQYTAVTVAVTAAHTALTAVRWEYEDDLREGAPDSVTDLTGSIRLGVASVVGATRADGLSVVVTCSRTGAQETVAVSWVGGANVVVTAGLLGQSVVSTSTADYLVSTSWPELPDLVDGTAGLQASGTVTWSLPQTTARRWVPSEVGTSTGYAIRVRAVTVASGAEPGLASLADGGGTWSILWAATQGRTIEESLGATDGSAAQTFDLASTPFLTLTALAIDGEEWTRVDDFLSSSPTDRAFTLLEQLDGAWRVTLGDGVRGEIPPALLSVIATYRVGGAASGNADAGAITRDRSANGRLTNLRNPRAAAGWVEAEGATPQGLELARVAIPASVRSRGVVVTPGDLEAETASFRTALGAQVAARAFALEEGNGPKTIAVVCVGPGGAVPTAAQLAELDVYLNGETAGVQRVGGVGLANVRLDPVAYTPEDVAVTATVSVLAAYVEGAEARIVAAVEAALSPLARRQVLGSDGAWVESTDYLWTLEGTVARAVLFAAIVTAQSGVVNVALTTPAADVTLGPRSLPRPGAIAVTVVAV